MKPSEKIATQHLKQSEHQLQAHLTERLVLDQINELDAPFAAHIGDNDSWTDPDKAAVAERDEAEKRAEAIVARMNCVQFLSSGTCERLEDAIAEEMRAFAAPHRDRVRELEAKIEGLNSTINLQYRQLIAARTRAENAERERDRIAIQIAEVERRHAANLEARNTAEAEVAKLQRELAALKAQGAGGKQWHTPAAQNFEKRRQVGQTKRTELLLPGQVKQWLTPTANEDAAGLPGAKMQPMLGSQVKADGPCHPAPRSTTGKPRGSLNPAWVSQLMGYPDGWLDLPDGTLSKLSATHRSRSASKSSRDP